MPQYAPTSTRYATTEARQEARASFVDRAYANQAGTATWATSAKRVSTRVPPSVIATVCSK